MGGLLRGCGCYDGPLSAEDRTLVKIRCAVHSPTGRKVMAEATVPTMAIPKSRKRRRS